MSSKPESVFIRSVHKYLPVEVHREKMANPYRGGTADCWYSGQHGDLWVEYKYLQKIPVRTTILPGCSALQLEWLRARHREGRNVAVILGSPDGSKVYRGLTWESPITPLEFRSNLLGRKEVAEWIVNAMKKSQNS